MIYTARLNYIKPFSRSESDCISFKAGYSITGNNKTIKFDDVILFTKWERLIDWGYRFPNQIHRNIEQIDEIKRILIHYLKREITRSIIMGGTGNIDCVGDYLSKEKPNVLELDNWTENGFEIVTPQIDKNPYFV